MSAILERFRRQPEQPKITASPIPEKFVNLPDYFEFDPSPKATQLREEIAEMLSSSEGLTEDQFVSFVEKMIQIAGGTGIKGKGENMLMIGAHMGQEMFGNNVELRRYMGDWRGPDAMCTKRDIFNAELTKSFPVVFEEDVSVFSYNLNIPPSVRRKIDIPIPSFLPKIQSVTGEEVQLFREIDLKETNDLTPQALQSIASSILSFYESTLNPPSNSITAAQ